ncbi:DUF6483 family protein [Paenibacillus aquistagni]|uniref:DUF6483 family protein n=1 Tax=Paenibacillus aquistagni TaxID=1852522 RepID=UPI00145A6208|nr:DUF6483 family protein [Paenibacillus aquistagni]NMM53222.1 hypothetical protein [Paenibacillus aquistagni]
MYQRDYLMRIIQEMTTMLGQLLGLQNEKKRSELLEEWEELLDRRFRIKGDLADSLSSADLIKLFFRHGNLQVDELQAFAIALTERAQLIQDAARERHPASIAVHDEDDMEASYIARMMQAYTLLLTARLNGSDRSMLNVQAILSEMPHKLRPYRLEDELLELLWRWHALEHRYAEAEDACYEWVERDDARLKQAVEWYEHLLQLQDDELEAGDLPRAEVEEAILMLKQRLKRAQPLAEHTRTSDNVHEIIDNKDD